MGRLPGMECLVNQFGIRRKVLIVERGVRCLESAGGGNLTGQSLRFFQPYFVFEVYPADGAAEYYRIGPTPRRDSIVGWVAASQVSPWDTRLGARYRRGADSRTPPLLVYADPQALQDLVVQGSTTKSPIARGGSSDRGGWMPWPITETVQFTSNGRVYEFVKLDFLGRYRAGADLDRADLDRTDLEHTTPAEAPAAYDDAELSRIESGVKMLDVVFCVDNTKSTARFIDAICTAVERISAQLQAFQPDTQFGLVLFRDYVEPIMFDDEGQLSAVKVYPLQPSLDAFLSVVRPLQPASLSSAGWPEAVYDGLWASLDSTPWRGQGLSTRVVVLIGDNSAHEPGDERNPQGISRQQIIERANERGTNVKIFSLCVDGRGGDAEQDLHRLQFQQVSQATGGENHPLVQADAIVDRVRRILDEQAAIVHERSAVVEALAAGKTPSEIVETGDLHVDEGDVADVMEFLAGAGVEVDRLAPERPVFGSGWCLAEAAGAPLLEREVYVARAEVDLLLAELNALCAHLSPDLAMNVFRAGFGSRENPMSFFADRRPEPMDVFLMARGIPCGQGILKRTRSEIEHMGEEERARLRERIARQFVPQLTNARNNDMYFTWLDDVEFGWIKEDLLP